MKNEKKITKIQEFIYDLKVSRVMTKDIIVAHADEKMEDVGEIFHSTHISNIPVVENDNFVGIIGIKDYLKWLENDKEDSTVAEKMAGKVKTVFEFSSIVEAIKKIDKFSYGSFPVLDGNLKLVGMISEVDIFKCLLDKLESGFDEEENGHTVSDLFFENIDADKAELKFKYFIEGKDLKRAGECASAIKKTLKRLNYDSGIIRRTAIAVYEAEMNMIIYADEGEIIAEVDHEKLKIYAIDKGPGIEDIKKAMTPGYSTAPDWVRALGFGAGMGLVNIDKCSDKMTIKSTIGKGTELEITFLS
ncbi:CBS domain-containing protein [Candidatus Latescibacterota bacterium]